MVVNVTSPDTSTEYDYVETVTTIVGRSGSSWDLRTDHVGCANEAGYTPGPTLAQFWHPLPGYSGLAGHGHCPRCQQRFRLLLPRHLIVAMALQEAG